MKMKTYNFPTTSYKMLFLWYKYDIAVKCITYRIINQLLYTQTYLVLHLFAFYMDIIPCVL